MTATSFAYDPASDYVGVVDDSTADVAKAFSDNLALRGNAIIGNDFVVASLIAMGLLPNCSATTSTPTGALDRDLWFDPTSHVLRRYDLAAGTWDVVNQTRMAEIIGGRGAGTISTSRTYRVPTDFATPWAAEQYLLNFAVAKTATVVVEITPGAYNHVAAMRGHPDGERITYKPTPGSEYTGGAPVADDFVTIGNSAAQVVTDRTANVAIVKSKYRVVINAVTDGVSPAPGYIFRATDLCFVGANTGSGIVSTMSATASVGGCAFLSFSRGWLTSFGGSIVSLTAVGKNCLGGNSIAGATASSGGGIRDLIGGFNFNNGDASLSAGGFFSTDSSKISCFNWQVIGINGPGLNVSLGGHLDAQGGTVKFCANNGLRGNSLGTMVFSSGASSNNLQYGGYVSGGGSIFMDTATFTSNTLGGLVLSQGATGVLTNAVISSNAGYGLNVTDGAVAALGATQISTNTGDGVVISGATVTGTLTATGNTGRGVYANNVANANISGAATSITGNGGNGILATNGSRVSTQGGTVTGNTTVDFNATNGAFINAQGYTGAPVFSPALNTVGNFNSYIRG